MPIDPKFLVNLSGKDFPLYAGVLAEAHEQGLEAIFTDLIQAPTSENEYTAIVKARVMMKGGKSFEAYGDASPRNVSARIATAILRMAETRSKGRALRDAINCGMTLLEELPDLEEPREQPHTNGHAKPGALHPRAQSAVQGAEKPIPVQKKEQGGEPGFCSAEGCGVKLNPGQITVSTQKYGVALCPAHQREAAAKG